MSILMLESFDAGDWNLQPEFISSSGTTLQTTSRTGTYGLRPANNSNYYAQWRCVSDTLIVGFGLNPATYTGESSRFLSLRGDYGSTQHINVTMGASNSVKVYRGTTLLGETDTFVLTPNVWNYVEIKVYLHDTAGTVALRVNGITPAGWSDLTSQDTKNGGTTTTFTDVYLFSMNNYTYFDDFYVCDTAGGVNDDFLGAIKIETLFPNGNGNYSNLLGSDADSTDNYLLVDEQTPSGTDYVGGATPGDKDTYTFEDVFGDITGVELRMYIQRSDANPKSIRAIHRRASTDSAGADHVLTDTWAAKKEIYDQDPNGPTAWTDTNLNDSEFGVEVRT